MAKSSTNQNQVGKLYQSVIDDVINNIREAFLDDGVDEQVLQELKQTWESKVVQSKAVQQQSDVTRHGPSGSMPMYVYNNNTGNDAHQVLYRQLPQGLQMTGAGHQATMALPNSVVYQQLSTAGGNQPQMYASYQPSSSQPTVVVASTTGGSASKATEKKQSSEIRQFDGASDELSQPKTTLNSPKKCFLTKAKNFKKSTTKKAVFVLSQMDGNVDSSSSDDDDDDDDDEDEDVEEEKPEAVDEEPLCSDDDGSDEDPVELFDTDNVVVCQYDKIHRTKSRWKFHLKVGIMNLNGRDYVFQKATGEADW